MKRSLPKLAALWLAIFLVFSLTAAPIFAAGAQDFSDVPQDAWYHAYVRMLHERSIVRGFGDSGEFRPDSKLTREQAAKMIVLAAGLAYRGKKADFPDVDKEGEMSPYIAVLVEKEAARGFPDGTFRPKDKITRGHAAKLVALAFGLNRDDLPYTLTDLPDDPGVKTAIEILASNGIVKGYEGTKSFKPHETISRAEFSKILCLAMVVLAIQRAEENPTFQNIKTAQDLLDELPQDQEKESLDFLRKRLRKLEKEPDPEPDPGPVFISVTGVTVDPTTAYLEPEDTLEIQATILPAHATNRKVQWTSNNEAVATVSNNGVVTAIKPGAAKISVTTVDKGFTATCEIVVFGDTESTFRVYNETKRVFYYGIQEAIDQADPGDTLVAGKGDFFEALIIDKHLTLKSAFGRDVTVIDASEDGEDSLFAIWIKAQEAGLVVIEGFTVKGWGMSGIVQIPVSPDPDGDSEPDGEPSGVIPAVHILNNKLEVSAGGYHHQYAIAVMGDESRVEGNEVSASAEASDDAWLYVGIAMRGASNSRVQDNRITGATDGEILNIGHGIEVAGGITEEELEQSLKVENILIADNEITCAFFAVNLWGNVDGATISGNSIRECFRGILIKGGVFVEEEAPLDPQNVTITGNTFSGNSEVFKVGLMWSSMGGTIDPSVNEEYVKQILCENVFPGNFVVGSFVDEPYYYYYWIAPEDYSHEV